MAVYFVSDLHLDEERPAITAVFVDFLRRCAREKADALYILGDLFEYWLGDDDRDATKDTVRSALAEATGGGLRVNVMRGNRDFLLGQTFAAQTGARLLDEPYQLNLYGISTLLMHGDLLCVDDLPYQRFRRKVRSAAWQAAFLANPLPKRELQVRGLRDESRVEALGKSSEILNVSPAAVEEVIRRHGVSRLIHGHTHRPGVHRLQIGGNRVERIVLGAWYVEGSALRCDGLGCRSVAVSAPDSAT